MDALRLMYYSSKMKCVYAFSLLSYTVQSVSHYLYLWYINVFVQAATFDKAQINLCMIFFHIAQFGNEELHEPV